ncbi:unnamed protein product [Vicia faba]|uniref:Uncharacterized protein n=1 Tax=Vicia faba TaxID=3906 RepID=A0AAV0YTQ3_VICFA|nr:unnamed protein product [Vicia faba]
MTPATIEVTTTFNHGFNDDDAADFPVWEKIGVVVRLSYGINVSLQGLGYAVPPTMDHLFILDDEVVKLSPHAHAIRDVEDEELWSFFMACLLCSLRRKRGKEWRKIAHIPSIIIDDKLIT